MTDLRSRRPMSDGEKKQGPVTALTGLEDALREVKNELAELRELRKINNGRKAWETFWRALSIVIMPILIAFSVYMLRLDNRVVRLEENQFTSLDGITLRTELADIIYQTEARIISSSPPVWLVDRINAIDARVQRIEGRGSGGDTEGGG